MALMSPNSNKESACFFVVFMVVSVLIAGAAVYLEAVG